METDIGQASGLPVLLGALVSGTASVDTDTRLVAGRLEGALDGLQRGLGDGSELRVLLSMCEDLVLGIGDFAII